MCCSKEIMVGNWLHCDPLLCFFLWTSLALVGLSSCCQQCLNRVPQCILALVWLISCICYKMSCQVSSSVRRCRYAAFCIRPKLLKCLLGINLSVLRLFSSRSYANLGVYSIMIFLACLCRRHLPFTTCNIIVLCCPNSFIRNCGIVWSTTSQRLNSIKTYNQSETKMDSNLY